MHLGSLERESRLGPRTEPRGSALGLAVRLPVVPEPASGPPPAGVVVGPVDDPALVVPFVLSAERDVVTAFEVRDARCEIDVVAHEYAEPVSDREEELLVTRSVEVVAQDLDDTTVSFDSLSRPAFGVQS